MSYQSTVRKLKLKYSDNQEKLEEIRSIQKMLTNISQLGDLSEFTYKDVKKSLAQFELWKAKR